MNRDLVKTSVDNSWSDIQTVLVMLLNDDNDYVEMYDILEVAKTNIATALKELEKSLSDTI